MEKIKKVILVSETLSISKEMMGMLKQGWSFEILRIVRSVKQAIPVVNSEQPQVILLDVELSDINHAKQLNSLNIPIVLLVNSHNDSKKSKFKNLSPAGYIVKPFDQLAIQNIIKQDILGSAKMKETNKETSQSEPSNNPATSIGKAPEQRKSSGKPGQRRNGLHQSSSKKGESS